MCNIIVGLLGSFRKMLSFMEKPRTIIYFLSFAKIFYMMKFFIWILFFSGWKIAVKWQENGLCCGKFLFTTKKRETQKIVKTLPLILHLFNIRFVKFTFHNFFYVNKMEKTAFPTVEFSYFVSVWKLFWWRMTFLYVLLSFHLHQNDS